MAQIKRPHRGFTLTEILVVIGIIVILVAILVPMVSRTRRSADAARMKLDIQAIVTALEQYKSDVHDYPRVVEAGKGSQTLADALVGPPLYNRSGFQLRKGGRTYGPYIQPDKFKISDVSRDKDVLGKPIPSGCLLDMRGNPILYYPARPGISDVTAAQGYVGESTDYTVIHPFLYNFSDNDDSAQPRFAGDAINNIKMMRAMLGDINGDGAIDAGETAAYTGPYIIWSAGSDGLFGPVDGSGAQLTSLPASADDVRQAVLNSDDVTNFQR